MQPPLQVHTVVTGGMPGWQIMLIAVANRGHRCHRGPTAGVSFVLVVATEGLAELAATLAVSYRAGWSAPRPPRWFSGLK